MRKILLACCGAALLAPASAALAQTTYGPPDAPVGKQAGAFIIRLRGIGVLPQDMSSSVTPIGGHVATSNSAGPELDFSYFLTDNLALELIAASTRHDIVAEGTQLGRVEVGSTWVLPPTLTLQYHFMPRQRFSPYIGAGLNVTWFYATHPAGPPVTEFGVSTNVGAALQIGFDYNVSGRWFLNADVKQIFLNANARINGGAIKAHTALDPTIVGVGVGYRF